MDITQDVKMKEVLTCDVGLGASGHRLCSCGLTLRGSKSDFGGVKVELQPPRLMGGHRKPLVSFIRLVDVSAELSTAARGRQR